MEAINFPKPTTLLNSIPSIPTKNLAFLAPNYPFFPKTLNPPPLHLPLCSKNSHTSTHNNNTVSENSDVKFSINPNKNDPQNRQPQTFSESKGLIFDLGKPESWDNIEIGCPVVKRFLSDDVERWYMWYYGRSEKDLNTGSIGLAVSSNGVHWEREDKVMKCSEDWWAFDTKSIRPSEIMIMSSNKVRAFSGVYWLYYTGFSSELSEIEDLEGFFLQFSEFLDNNRVLDSLPGLAISQDGRNWARIEGEHHSGALFDVGSKGEWDSMFIASPHVVFHSNGDLRMYYHSFDLEDRRFGIGIARSRDGIKWVKLGKIKSIGQGSSGESEGCFDEMGVLNACVVRDKKVGNYIMAYEGIDRDGKRSIGMAISEDGLKDWRPVSDKAVLMGGSENEWDCKGVGTPCLAQMEGNEDQWRIYYTGFGVEGRSGIGLATSQGDITNFRKWEGFIYD